VTTLAIAVEFRNISKSYKKRIVLDGVNLTISKGDFTVIYGLPSSGKSVLMRLLMGLEKPTQGEIWLRGSEASGIDPGERNIGYVPQSFALYPHLSVYDNIAYPLKMKRVHANKIEPIVTEAARLLKIESLLQKRPDQISGGQKQRVAIARGIVKQTDIYILDDPLAGLDFKLREQLVDDLKQLQDRFGMTFIYTTSDPIESLALAKHVAVLDGGRIVESGTPDQLYDSPAHVSTMRLIGFPPANVLHASWYEKDGRPWCKTELIDFPVQWDEREGGLPERTGEAFVGFRPESIEISGDSREGMLSFPCRLALREDLGGEEIVYLESGGAMLTAVLRHEGNETLADLKQASIDPSNLIVFDRRDGRRIGKGAPHVFH
jgi:ABC-type sugar transport system ATPase subunit